MIISPFLSNKDAVRIAIGTLSLKDIQNFELVTKSHCQVTNLFWKALRKKNGFEYSWGECEKVDECQRDKWNYCLGLTLKKYMDLRVNGKSLESAQLLYARFQKIFAKFPVFGSFFKEDLLEKSSCNPLHSSEMMNNLTQIHENALAGFGGEVALQGLRELKHFQYDPKSRSKEQFDLTLQYMTQAVDKKAWIVLFSALSHLCNKEAYDQYIWNSLFHLFSTAFGNGALDTLNPKEIEKFKKEWRGLAYPKQYDSNHMLTNATSIFQCCNPEYIGYISTKLEFYDLAEEYYDKSVRYHTTDPTLLFNAGLVKTQLKKYSEAENLLKIALDKCKDKEEKLPKMILHALEQVKELGKTSDKVD